MKTASAASDATAAAAILNLAKAGFRLRIIRIAGVYGSRPSCPEDSTPILLHPRANCKTLNHAKGIDPFADAKPRLSRRGRKARLRVNPEQAPAFMPGSRGVDSPPVAK
jgi:hypothetical protein